MRLVMDFWNLSMKILMYCHIINYLKATNIEGGLLLNFGRKPEFKRFVYDNKRKKYQ